MIQVYPFFDFESLFYKLDPPFHFESHLKHLYISKIKNWPYFHQLFLLLILYLKLTFHNLARSAHSAENTNQKARQKIIYLIYSVLFSYCFPFFYKTNSQVKYLAFTINCIYFSLYMQALFKIIKHKVPVATILSVQSNNP